jgi:hypothetical protein
MARRHRARGPGGRQEASGSFLKKRTKKLFLPNALSRRRNGGEAIHPSAQSRKHPKINT